ncbi:hypothetical protein KR009_008022, partial [Drosophila setifemur]
IVNSRRMVFSVEFLGTVLVMLLILHKSMAEMPTCNYYDTVPLSAGQRFPNGSYLYEGLLIPAHLTGEYNFRVNQYNVKESVKSHWRGCACQLSVPCIRFCCIFNPFTKHAKCSDHLEEEITHTNFYINVTLRNGSIARLHSRKDMIRQSDLINRVRDRVLSYKNLNDFTIFENGSILRHFNNKLYDRTKYCFSSEELFSGHLQFLDKLSDVYSAYSTYFYVLFSSMVGVVLTIAVYFYLNLVRTHHGKCFVCYLICVLAWYISWCVNVITFGSFCSTLGYVQYFFGLACNIWLVTISLELRNTFITGNSANLRFRVSSAISWIIPAVPTGIMILLDFTIDPENGNEKWRPNMDAETCWLKPYKWVSFLYYHGPVFGMHLINLIMFIQTTLRILAEKRELKNLTDSQEGQQRIKSASQTFFFLLRISGLMGLPWIFNLICYIFPIQTLKCVGNLDVVRGIIIFVLFVLERSTLRLFCKR